MIVAFWLDLQLIFTLAQLLRHNFGVEATKIYIFVVIILMFQSLLIEFVEIFIIANRWYRSFT